LLRPSSGSFHASEIAHRTSEMSAGATDSFVRQSRQSAHIEINALRGHLFMDSASCNVRPLSGTSFTRVNCPKPGIPWARGDTKFYLTNIVTSKTQLPLRRSRNSLGERSGHPYPWRIVRHPLFKGCWYGKAVWLGFGYVDDARLPCGSAERLTWLSARLDGDVIFALAG
jgi:hypothetical protein